MTSISLSKNENRYPASPLVLQYLKNISPSILETYNFSIDPLITKISEQYKVPSENIFLANGGEEILKSAIESVVKRGDSVLLPQGGWAYYKELVEEMGGVVEYFPLYKTKDSYYYDTKEIETLLETKKAKMLILASPNNPTGHMVEKLALQSILQKSEKLGIYVLLDEAYEGFGSISLSYKNMAKDYPTLLVLRTFSKFFSLAGLRVGYAFFGENWKPLSKHYRRYLGFSRLSSDIAFKALESFSHYEANAKLLIYEREQLEKFLREQGFVVYTSYANFIFCLLPSELFAKASVFFPKQGLMIKFFDGNKEPWFHSCIRITVGLPPENHFVRELFLSLFQ